MFRKRTLLVLGAGASAEVDMPVGTKLADRIADCATRLLKNRDTGADTDAALWNATLHIRHSVGDSDFYGALDAIRQGVRLVSSIDRFIEMRSSSPAIERAGKLLIAYALLEAEQKSGLSQAAPASRDPFDFDVHGPLVKDAWYNPFLAAWTSRVQDHAIHSLPDNLAIISFNYDRCVELALTVGLRRIYSLDTAAAAKIVSQLTIIHPYGSLGPLPGMAKQGERPVGFGDHHLPNLSAVAEGLQTFGESRAEGIVDRIQGELERAERVIFLGFSFEPMNMLLFGAPRRENPAKLYGTTKGMPAPAAQMAVNALRGLTLRPQESVYTMMEDMTCTQLVNHYSATWD